MDAEQKDALRERNYRRGNCRRCGSPAVRRLVDGKDLGGDHFAGILYDICQACGFDYPRPKARKPKEGGNR
jgi:hypothetical protein